MDHDAEIRGVGVSVEEEGIGAPAVILEARDEVLPIYITPDQARSIQLALATEPPDRPLTHDLLVDMLTEFGGAIDRVRIDGLSNGTFLAKVDAERYEAGEAEQYVFDARPSDGIALALRVDCALSVADTVLDAAGQPPEQFKHIEDAGDDVDEFLGEGSEF